MENNTSLIGLRCTFMLLIGAPFSLQQSSFYIILPQNKREQRNKETISVTVKEGTMTIAKTAFLIGFLSKTFQILQNSNEIEHRYGLGQLHFHCVVHVGNETS